MGDIIPPLPDDWKMFGKYKIEHVDGTPLKGKDYFVLRLDSDDPIEAARVKAAMAAYRGERSLPRRNCDRFQSGDVDKDADDAMKAMLEEMKEAREKAINDDEALQKVEWGDMWNSLNEWTKQLIS